MKKGKRLNQNELEKYADGKTKIVVVSQTGAERLCILTKECLEDAINDVKEHYCEMYLSK